MDCFFENPEIIFCLFFFHFFNLNYFQVLILLKYIEGMYLIHEEKRRDIVFGILWCVMLVYDEWLWISCRYLVLFEI